MNKKELLMRFFITVPVIAFIFLMITKTDICKSSVENAVGILEKGFFLIHIR